jgi:CRP/FNR family transcriptional regulator, cyclic AMP receptor protein
VLDLAPQTDDPAPPAPGTRTVFVLEQDPDLAGSLSPQEREQASHVMRARVIDVPKGRWQPPEVERGAFGVLILDGLMTRSVAFGRASSAELAGPGDILRPREDALLDGATPGVSDWRVLEGAQVAILDRQVTTIIGHWPELCVAFSARLLRRAQCLAYLKAASQFTHLEDRLLTAFWHLARLWGRVGPDGVVVPFKLTHEMLGQIAGAQRPPVTNAIGTLRRSGQLDRRDDGRYVLLGQPPPWLREQEEEPAYSSSQRK